MDAFDADALIFAATPDHEFAQALRALLETTDRPVGSVLLLPEVLIKPTRSGWHAEYERLVEVLSRLLLLGVDEITASLAVTFGAKYGLRAVDAAHLATAVSAGADRFLTNNRADFPKTITEIDVTYPSDL